MRVGIYTIFDAAANDIGPVFQAKTLAVAERQFKRAIEPAGEFAEELQLWRLGFLDVIYEMDDGNNVISVCEPKLTDLFEVVSLGSDFVSKGNKELLHLMDYKEGKKDA